MTIWVAILIIRIKLKKQSSRKSSIGLIVWIARNRLNVCKHKEEHMGDQGSSVYKHSRIGHKIDWDNMEILDTARDQR
jgi:hypothetical protein